LRGVHAGATGPAANWLDHLADGGRLALPLTTDEEIGHVDFVRTVKREALVRIERRGSEYLATWVSHVAIFRRPQAAKSDER
jgi:protein-L-isoaspartate(D-aspartate) O-methyltransferase